MNRETLVKILIHITTTRLAIKGLKNLEISITVFIRSLKRDQGKNE